MSLLTLTEGCPSSSLTTCHPWCILCSGHSTLLELLKCLLCLAHSIYFLRMPLIRLSSHFTRQILPHPSKFSSVFASFRSPSWLTFPVCIRHCHCTWCVHRFEHELFACLSFMVLSPESSTEPETHWWYQHINRWMSTLICAERINACFGDKGKEQQITDQSPTHFIYLCMYLAIYF